VRGYGEEEAGIEGWRGEAKAEKKQTHISMSETSVYSNPWLQWQRTATDELLAAAGRWSQAPTLWERARRIRKGVSPSEVVYEEDRLKLLHYLNDTEPKYKIPLVFIYALVNRPYILDLKAGRSVVANFVKHGFDTYLVDWGIPTFADRHLTLDDYINGYVANVLDYVRERTGSEKINVLGYCMGGTMSAMFTALHQDRVKNLILLAAPLDFSANAGCSISGPGRRISMSMPSSTRLGIARRNSCRQVF
jgi:polyhydroxyalkanoate synthase